MHNGVFWNSFLCSLPASPRLKENRRRRHFSTPKYKQLILNSVLTLTLCCLSLFQQADFRYNVPDVYFLCFSCHHFVAIYIGCCVTTVLQLQG
ncbi:hypothetical protein BJ741DRAFT_365599 [Chytriomyces cf. hyalinus JEL632]|nr:hypothetical protein BJ741DRAFT_365599 [Chytriomyces cf. hyalinus JEL632]